MESIAQERANTTFPVREMTYFLDGGKNVTELKERFMLELERDPTWKMDDYANLTLAEIRERTMAKAKIIVHHLANEPVHIFRQRMAMISTVDPAFWTRLGVHYGLFIGALQGQATSSQFTYWVQKGALALNGVIGCFGMTELGHGSNVAGLETTATFDEAADEFVIHTPSITATKWWIGGAAQTATHCAVFAQLIVKGKRYGVKPFVVQLRNTDDFSLRPGINIGDCGKKMGRDGIDNGWIQFTNVRIPRSHMLMKHTKVSRDGTVTEPPMQQLAYGALIQGRVAMVVDSGNTAKKALTIALRYAAIRRQFASKHGALENKLIDYPIHQYRLLPLLAQTFAMHFTGIEMDKMYTELNDQLIAAKPGQNLDHVLEMLKETHSTSAGLKAFCTWACLNIIEQCRQSMGGHGYSAYTGLAGMANDFAVQCTWEGDNTILTLQAGRYLIGCYRDALNGKKLPPGVGYFNQLPSILTKKCSQRTIDGIASFDVIREAFGVVSANVVKMAAERFEKARKSGKDADEAFEECSADRFFAAKIHSFGYLFNRFADGIANAPSSLKPVLDSLCKLYALYTISENSGVFLQYKYFDADQMDLIKLEVTELCKTIRTDVVGLVDSFNFSDYAINSPMGRYDGNIYQAYFNQVRRSNPHKPHPYFDRLIKPLLHRSVDEEEAPEVDE
ncbi:acyl-CoA dehydrogenase/oxidase C-terminal [Paraphysoderma sedebokerense]|nr:acyl-CoA dehydrogenase/oxidase C-terminal [Paraphysoderma sedebokerense]